jgi:Tol biopolymer transport system component
MGRVQGIRVRGTGSRRIAGWAVWLLAGLAGAVVAAPAEADFDCGTALVSCQVQLDNAGDAWFGSIERLTDDALGDGTLRNGVFQVYERSGNTTTLLKGPDGRPIPGDSHRGSARLSGVSPDGKRVYIETQASLTAEDADPAADDSANDGYEIADGRFRLLTTGPLEQPSAAPFANNGGHLLWASADGRYVYFETFQRLLPEDWDDASDIYQRFEGQTRLVSTGPDEFRPTAEWPTPFVADSRFLGASPDGSTAYFATAQYLTPGDSGKSPGEGRFMTSDIFAWHDGVTTRLTRTVSPEEVPGTPWESFDPYSFAGAADEGSVYFIARSGQVPEDTDQNPDIYRAKPDGTLERVVGSGMEDDRFLRVEAVSRDGSRIFLARPRWLNPAGELELEEALFMWSGGRYQSLTPPSRTPVKDAELALCAISSNGSRAYFQTRGTLSPQDTDAEPDVYEWHDGDVRLVSPASDGRQSAAFCSGISPNGRYVAFSTWEDLVPGDNDVKSDIYLIDMGAESTGASASSASRARRHRPHRRRHRRRLKLLTAEAIAPRMRIGTVARLHGGSARLRLACPKDERSGPCHGVAVLLRPSSHRVLARGRFRIRAGRRARVELAGRSLSRRDIKRALARVRGADLLGNAATVTRAVRLRRAAR